MRSYISLLLVIFSFSLSQPLYAHQSDSKLEIQQLKRFLDYSFVRIKKIDLSKAEDPEKYISFVGPQGTKIHAAKSKIADALAKAYTHSLELKGECVGHCHSHKNSFIKETAHEIAEGIKALPKTIPVASSEVVRMSAEVGFIPSIVLASIFVATYPVYTVATEVVESMFLGPLHAFCHFFQVIYFSAFASVKSVPVKMTEYFSRIGIHRRVTGKLNFIRPLKSLMNDISWQLRSTKTFSQTHNSTTRKSDFLKASPTANEAGIQLSLNRQWILTKEKFYRSLLNKGELPEKTRDVAFDQVDTLRSLIGVMRNYANLSYKEGNLRFTRLLRFKYIVGRWTKLLRNFEAKLSSISYEDQEQLKSLDYSFLQKIFNEMQAEYTAFSFEKKAKVESKQLTNLLTEFEKAPEQKCKSSTKKSS